MLRRGQRSLLHDVLSPAECRELTFIHKGLASAGYSPHLWTTKLADLAYTAPPLLLPLVAARDKVTGAAEAALGHSFELCTEFTGLVSWTEGAAIHWHHDSNRPHLEQRVATAVVYLNDAREFEGGQLQFQDGDLRNVAAAQGSMVTFMADAANVHRVTEVTAGERLTLTLWFTLRPEHSEDTAVLRQLQPGLPSRRPPESLYQDCGADIRMTRLTAVGLRWVPEAEAAKLSSAPCKAAEGHSSGRLRPVDGRHCGGNCGNGAHFGSLQAALQALAWLQWHASSIGLDGGCICARLRSADPGGYLDKLAALLPAAVKAWREAGLLYCTA